MTLTPPLAAGGRSFTLTPGVPVLLTEYAAGPDAPLTVMNLNAAGGAAVYVAATSGVSAASGVPVAAGTSLPWTAAGQLWAIVPDGGTTTTVVLTGAVGIVPVAPVPVPQASQDTWELAGTQFVNGTVYDFARTAPGNAFGSTLANVSVSAGSLAVPSGDSIAITLVMPSIDYQISLASLSGNLTPSTPAANSTVTVPRGVAYTVQAVSNISGGPVGFTVNLVPNS